MNYTFKKDNFKYAVDFDLTEYGEENIEATITGTRV